MSEQSKKSTKNFIEGVKSEYKKIILPNKETIKKQAIAVLSASVALGVVISLLDFLFQMGFGFIIK